MITNLTPSQLRKAAAIKEQIDALEAEMNALLAGAVAPGAKAPGGKRQLSAAGRARIAAAARARWAKVRAEKGIAPRKEPTRTLSAAAKARLAAIARARWAKVKAAGKTKL